MTSDDNPATEISQKPDQIDSRDVAAILKAFSVHIESWWSGPLPKPSNFVAYNEAQPDASERILRMAERQQRNHMWIRMVPLLVVTISVIGSI